MFKRLLIMFKRLLIMFKRLLIRLKTAFNHAATVLLNAMFKVLAFLLYNCAEINQ
jgi:hypothetical protein